MTPEEHLLLKVRLKYPEFDEAYERYVNWCKHQYGDLRIAASRRGWVRQPELLLISDWTIR